ncbi:scavenger receptor class B member 1-like [Leguminivora glycinivorella]|uniref:scavenger receptor class B member 1-like n=1 Tax=Leguminivora glycinivorella TaxID=1035111 RepID=UPI00200D15E9|nr:scavenger receptor class B member 1-like [Leguminivora glycinivorella]
MAFNTTREAKLMARKRLIIAFFSGVLCIVVSVILMAIDPVHIIAKFQTRIAPNSLPYHLLESEVEGVHVKAYLFNVTNPEEFLSGRDRKMKMQEIGPFSYKELRSNDDLELDQDKGVVRYTPNVNVEFVPEESIGRPEDINVTIPNIAMLSMTAMMSSYPFWTRLGYNALQKQVDSRAIITVPAHEYLWGYDEALITMGNTFMPGWIHFSKMGIMDRLYDKSVPNRLEVGAKDSDKFEIKSMNGISGLRPWGYENNTTRTKCNTFINAYEGVAYPDDLTPDTEIRIFRNVLCRFLELDFKEQITMDFGADALVYKISNRTFSPGKDNECLCGKGICMDGLSDLSPCFYGLPLAMSNAHFLNAPPEMYERIEGLEPSEAKHGGRFLIEPQIGAVIETEFTVQVNIVMGDVSFNDEAKATSGMVVPVGYFRIILPALPEHTKQQLNLMYKTGPAIFLAVEICLYILGAVLIAYSFVQVCRTWLCADERAIEYQTPSDEKKATILCVPLMDFDSKSNSFL